MKTAIFGGKNARLYGVDVPRTTAALAGDRFAALNPEYQAAGASPSNRRYGFVKRG